MNDLPYDLLIVGGGINGAGIARDAAGRGLKVLLVEKDDLAAYTSSWSTKLIHGGLRYLEHYEFRLVAESLREREVLLHAAPHIIEPLAFVLPHEPHLRPAWMIRAGLFFYDHLGGRMSLPKSFGVRLTGSPYGAGLKPRFKRGFVYSDARVDDARLVVINAMDARARGAEVCVRTRFVGARREGGSWRADIDENGVRREIRARALVNAAGPWVKDVLDTAVEDPGPASVRHVKGSHIVVPRVHAEPHAYILQNADQRIVFIIPYLDRFSLIGTTDVPVETYGHPSISEDEVVYLLALTHLAPYFPGLKAPWTERATLPGGDIPRGNRGAWIAELQRRYPELSVETMRAIAGRHGSLATQILGNAAAAADLGEDFGAGLTERELQYLVDHEWARSAEDILWRRTKCGLMMDAPRRERVAAWLARARP